MGLHRSRPRHDWRGPERPSANRSPKASFLGNLFCAFLYQLRRGNTVGLRYVISQPPTDVGS